MKCEKYDCGKVIGEGAYSQVRLATDTTTNKKCALKIFKLNCEESKEVLNEARLLDELSHPHIVAMLDYSEEAKLVKEKNVKKVSYVAFELAEKGSLFTYVANTDPFSEKIAKYLYSQILDGVEYLHLNGVSHRDIKLENVVLDSNCNVKLCDFGFATKNTKCSTFKGTEVYMAPEIHQKNGYHSQTTDIFALGVLLFVLVTGVMPFVKATPNDCHYKLITHNKFGLFWKNAARNAKVASQLSPELKNLIEMMLSPNDVDRPSLSEIRQSEWISSTKPISTQDLKIEFSVREEVLKKKQDDEF